MKQFFSVLFLFVFVSSVSLTQNQLAVDKGADFIKNPNPSVYIPNTPLEEVFGSNAFAFGPSGLRGRGNVFHCTTPKKLIEQRQYLNPTAAASIQFVVYEGATFAGVYNLVTYTDVSGQGPGEGWYSSGPMDYDLQAGMYYLIYAQWDVNANYYNQQSITPYPIPCSFGELVGGVGWDWAPTYAVPPSATQTSIGLEGTGVAYYQTIVTDDIGGGNIFFEDFDGFIAGQQLACQDPVNWTTWSIAPCGSEDAFVSSNYAYSGSNSTVVVSANDLVKPLGDQTTGKWYISFLVYIPAGKSGYFNTLTGFTPNTIEWAHDCFFDAGGGGRLDITGGGGGGTVVPFTYTVAAWNQIILIIDLDALNSPAEFWIGTSPSTLTMVSTWDWTNGGLKVNRIAANDFYGFAATDEMYFDNYYFGDAMPPIIPVELTSFTGNVNNLGQVVLNWQTATELNNQGFEIERRTESSEFRTIAFIAGAGTVTETRNYNFVDKTADQGINYYRLKQLDFDGSFAYSDEVEVDVTAPLAFNLDQNYPNPFNPSTNVKFSVPEAGNVKLSVYNLVGEEVAVLVNGFSQAGTFEVTFDASNLSTGVYLYKLQSANSVQTKKMMLLK
jgi:hypothetical protein